jgi:hypothetical protein
VKAEEPNAKTPPARAGFLAALGAALIALGLLLPVSAAADGRIADQVGSGPGQVAQLTGLAVSRKEGGDVYVLDAASNQRVSQFHPNGTFVRAFGWGVRDGAAEPQTCTALTGCQHGIEGSGPGQLRYSDEIAIDNSCAEQEPPLSGFACETFDPSYGDVYVVDQRNYRVEKFDPEGNFLLMFGGEVNKTAVAESATRSSEENVCPAPAHPADSCGTGLPGTGHGFFYSAGLLTSTTSWSNESNNSIAVGPDGTVYAGDYQRVQEIEPSGAYKGELSLPDANFVTALAVDSAGDLFERSATYQGGGGPLLSQVPGVREYEPAGTPRHLINTLDTEEATSQPTHIALDAEGNLFLSDHGGGEFRFRAFKPSGALYSLFTSDQVEASFTAAPRGIAIGDAAGKLYATDFLPGGQHIAVIPLPVPGPPLVKEEHADQLQPTTATLHAVVNPEGFSTEYRFQYITEAAFQANPPGEEFNGAEETPVATLPPLIHDDPVAAPISGLLPETAYRYRIVAHNSFGGGSGSTADGPAEALTTLPPVSFRDLNTQTVAPELVTIKAEANNNNSLAAGHWTICIGKEAGNYTECSEGELKAGSHEFEPIEATFTHLNPNTEYHYRLTAHNSYPGEFETADQAFTTEETLAEQDARENCPNALLREENNSTALPDCRAYEQVSPADKGGSEVFPTPPGMLAPSGERAAFASPGAFAGVEASFSPFTTYGAVRTETGWRSWPTVGVPGPDARPQSTRELDAELDTSLFQVFPGKDAGSPSALTELTSETFYLANPDRSLLAATPSLNWAEPSNDLGVVEVVAQSTGLSRLFLLTEKPLLPALDPRPEGAGHNPDRIYEVSGAGGPAPALRLAAEVSLGLPPSIGSGCEIDPESSLGTSTNTSAADGSTLFYLAPLELSPGAECQGTHPNKLALFACDLAAGPCVEGQPGYHAPVQLSAESPTECTAPHPCAGAAPSAASFYAAMPSGAGAWFTTAQPLIDADADSAEDLYLARFEGGQLTRLQRATGGDATDPNPTAPAGLQGVVKVSADGNRAYFVATGVLTEDENALHQSAAQGADNLYLYDASSKETKFLARLCSGPEESGSLADPACPSDLDGGVGTENGANDAWLWHFGPGGGRRANLSPDGRFLVFDSNGRLAPGDTDNAPDVYRYDAQSGELARVSFGHRGNDANGNDSLFPAELAEEIAGRGHESPANTEDEFRSISADGSRVVFTTAAPLVSRDTNEGAHPSCGQGSIGCDVYQWEEDGHGSCEEAAGCVSLLSSGLGTTSVLGGVLSSSGRDVAFTTASGLVPGDVDGLPDLYDARAGGGFAPQPPPQICGGAETCHGPATESTLHPNCTTCEFEAPPPPKRIQCAKGRHRVTKHGQERCVPNKKHHKAKKHHKRAARHNRRAGK